MTLSLLQNLLELLLESFFESVLGSLLERASHQEEWSFQQAVFGHCKTLSLSKLWLIEGSESGEVLMLTLT